VKNIKDADRLNSLRATRLLDSPATPAFDRLTQLASKLLGVPSAMVTLVDDNRQFFKSAVGLPQPWAALRETPLSHSFCQHVVETGGPVVVPDARLDAKHCDHPAIRDMNIVSYLGVPLRTTDGYTLGSFCVTDSKPRAWLPGEVGLVSELAQSVISEIDLHVKVAEQRDLLHRYQLWLNRMPVACFTCDSDCRITAWNPAAERIFGFPANTALGQWPHELLFAAEHRDAVAGHIQDIIAGRTLEHCHRPCRAADGHDVICHWTLTPLPLADGRFNGFIAMAEDITAQAQAEEKRVELETQLRQSQKMDAIGQLAGGVAHDFNNILTAIHTSAALQLDPTCSALEMREAAGQIVTATNRAAELTRQLLVFSRRQAMHRVPQDLNETVRSTAQMLQRLLGANVTMQLNCAADAIRVSADAAMLGQVLLNLAVNARDAMPHGGQLTVRTTVQRIAPRPLVSGARLPVARHACLKVSDTGVGIAPEILPRIFEPFFTTKPTGKGTGLGLATVYGIIAQHGGWVDVRSTPGRGTTFHVYLPLHGAPSETAEMEDAVVELPRGTETVLVVEDEEMVRKLLSRLLRRLGYQVMEVHNGAAALPVLRERHQEIQLVLTDLVMPERIGGLALAAETHTFAPQLPFLFMSGYNRDHDPADTMLVEGVNYLRKPFKTEDLARMLRQALGTRDKQA
jgi:PAS domain S-box-containing protein